LGSCATGYNSHLTCTGALEYLIIFDATRTMNIISEK